MASSIGDSSVSKKANVIGWIVSIVPCLLHLMSATMKFVQPAGFDEGLQHMGWTADKMKIIGVVEILCVIIYLIPKTSVLGAILIAAYLGGAVATHVRVGDPFIVPIIVGVLVWLGLWLRDPRIKALVPLKSSS